MRGCQPAQPRIRSARVFPRWSGHGHAHLITPPPLSSSYSLSFLLFSFGSLLLGPTFFSTTATKARFTSQVIFEDTPVPPLQFSSETRASICILLFSGLVYLARGLSSVCMPSLGAAHFDGFPLYYEAFMWDVRWVPVNTARELCLKNSTPGMIKTHPRISAPSNPILRSTNIPRGAPNTFSGLVYFSQNSSTSS